MATPKWNIVDCPDCGNSVRFAVGEMQSQVCPLCRTLVSPDGRSSGAPGTERQATPSKLFRKPSLDEEDEDMPRLDPLSSSRESSAPPGSSREIEAGMPDPDPVEDAGAEWPGHEETDALDDPHGSQPASSDAAESQESGIPVRKRRRSRSLKDAPLEWDEAKTDRSERAVNVKRSTMAWAALGGLAVVGTLLFVVAVLQTGTRTDPTPGEDPARQRVRSLSISELFADGAVPPRDVLVARSSEILDLARPQLQRFLNAGNLEERLKTVRAPGRVEPLMRAFYQSHPDGPIIFRQIAPDGQIVMKDNFSVVQVLMEDWSARQIALDISTNPPLVDWESYVGYSEATLSELKETRPTDPVLIRTGVEWASAPYYNYDFNDEEKYDCYVLSRRDDPAFLFGYAERLQPTSTALRSIVATSGGNQFLAVLRVRFPENARTDNQVIIEEFIVEGWVLPDEKDQAAD